jgi:hypothetical protein
MHYNCCLLIGSSCQLPLPTCINENEWMNDINYFLTQYDETDLPKIQVQPVTVASLGMLQGNPPSSKPFIAGATLNFSGCHFYFK